MKSKLIHLFLMATLFAAHAYAQTTNGLVTGAVTDPSGAVIASAEIDVANQETGSHRTTTSSAAGIYVVPQLPPGVYTVSAKAQGFATQNRQNVRLEVNQSVTLDFHLGAASVSETVDVSGAPPLLNTTSATLSTVVAHDETVSLPLNGREFTQLTLLTPGAAPVQGSQQTSDTVALGAGGISPSVNGQRGEQNNFTMDGVLNNSIFTNVWAIAPPPDALQEFNVQSHITDAQFAISSGANINVVTRSGTNNFHGAAWEFLRNDVLDAQTFPDTKRLPYKQNQYGVYFGGPVEIPGLINGRDNTWFSFYWEGFRSTLTQTVKANTLTAAMRAGDFSGISIPIYDPSTSTGSPGSVVRSVFTGNIIPTNRLNPASLAIINKYYPLPNLNVAEGVLPNLEFPGNTTIDSDVFGLRLDHKFTDSDTVFLRFNRSNAHLTRPENLPTYGSLLSNYAQEAAVGYTHAFGPKTILDFRFGYTYTNDLNTDQQAGLAFDNAINFTQAVPPRAGLAMGPFVSLSNGYSGVNQFAIPLGPQEGMDYHADLSKVVSNHTIGVGAMYYHILSYDDGWGSVTSFTPNATSSDGTASATSGFGPASFLLGVPDGYAPWVGNIGAFQKVNWYGLYAQDQWQVTRRLALTYGVRWDYVSPPDLHKTVSGLDALTGQFLVTGAVPPFFSKANTGSGYFNAQHNGFEPRFGITYAASERTVLHAAFAMLDDHNNTVVQENQGLRLTWPSGIAANLTSLDLAQPTYYLNGLPPASFFLNSLAPYASFGANPNNKIPYSMQFNGGIQQQLSKSMFLKIDYVGSLSRHQYIVPDANTAVTPGPGLISARQPFPQYGGPFFFESNVAPASYNALQVQLEKTLSSGLFFRASYTWSKSLDWQSDPYGTVPVNFYNLPAEWGPSDYNRTHMFVFSGVYALPFGRQKAFFSNANGFTQALIGGWNLGTIISLNSGAPFSVLAGGDISNTGDPDQRAQRTGADPYQVSGGQSYRQWLNPAAFAVPSAFTYGNEHRNDLVGPAFRDVDFNASKDFPLTERAKLQFRAEFFNFLNHTNYKTPDNGVQDASFGQLLGTVGPGREMQFALKVIF